MRRFITYLYEYENGQKTKNTGFIRVDERNGKVIFQISVRNFIRSQEKGEIYAFVRENGLQGIEIGRLTILNSQTDVRLELESANIKDTGYSLDQLVGVGLVFPSNGYMASCWNDAYAEVIGSGRFRMWGDNVELKAENVLQKQTKKEIREEKIDASPEFGVQIEASQVTSTPQENKVEVQESTAFQEQEPLQAASYELVTYQKMELNAIKSLPSPNWYLCNNRFLVHGFFNYGYLILKKTSEADAKKTYLGVPGIYEKPEMVMATLFGFPEFQTLPKEVSSAKMEEVITAPTSLRQEAKEFKQLDSKLVEPKQGAFGCWLIPIQG